MMKQRGDGSGRALIQKLGNQRIDRRKLSLAFDRQYDDITITDLGSLAGLKNQDFALAPPELR
jgi:hypothetical protein